MSRMGDAERKRIAAIPHSEPGHACSWACPQANPLADVRGMAGDIWSGMTLADLHRKYHRDGPLYGIPYSAEEQFADLLKGDR